MPGGRLTLSDEDRTKTCIAESCVATSAVIDRVRMIDVSIQFSCRTRFVLHVLRNIFSKRQAIILGTVLDYNCYTPDNLLDRKTCADCDNGYGNDELISNGQLRLLGL